MQVAFAKNRYVTRWKSSDIDWPSFLDYALRDRVINATRAEYDALKNKANKTKEEIRASSDKIAKLKDGESFLPVTINGPRKSHQIVDRFMITLDIEHIDQNTATSIVETLQTQNYQWLAHTTASHTAESPRLRIIVPLARGVDARLEYGALSRTLAKVIHNKMNVYDDTTFQPERLMYLPAHLIDEQVLVWQAQQDIPILDPDLLLQWAQQNAGLVLGDFRTYPISDRVKLVPERTDFKRAGVPIEKSGIVGAFNRCYDIPQAIDEFLSDQYIAVEGYGGAPSGRYTYVDGDGFGGLTLYSDDAGHDKQFAYSHHSTDPAGQRLVNAFDLVRLHLFGDQDARQKEDTPVHKLNSHKLMEEYAMNMQHVQDDMREHKLSSINAFAGEDIFVDETERPQKQEETSNISDISLQKVTKHDKKDENVVNSWQQELQLTSKGKYKETIDNYVLLLTHLPPLKAALWHNEFDGGDYARGALPWNATTTERPWTDGDDSALRHYLEKNFELMGASRLKDAMRIVSMFRTYHPVREYMQDIADKTVWDGQERAAYLVRDFLGSEGTEIEQAFVMKWLVASVRRLYNPGYKFDNMIVLIGPQGYGKSSLFRFLLGNDEWFTDSLDKISGREGAEAIQGIQFGEFAEMETLNKSEIGQVKMFLSKSTDRYRAAYAARVEPARRQIVFYGTTNEHEFLNDPSGGRRFWAIEVTKQQAVLDMRDELRGDKRDKNGQRIIGRGDTEYKRQVWSEVLIKAADNFSTELNTRENREAKVIQERHRQHDARQSQIEAFVFKKLPQNWETLPILARRNYLENGVKTGDAPLTYQRRYITAAEVWVELFGNELSKIMPRDKRAINNILATIPGVTSHVIPPGSIKEPRDFYGHKQVRGFKIEKEKKDGINKGYRGV